MREPSSAAPIFFKKKTMVESLLDERTGVGSLGWRHGPLTGASGRRSDVLFRGKLIMMLFHRANGRVPAQLSIIWHNRMDDPRRNYLTLWLVLLGPFGRDRLPTYSFKPNNPRGPCTAVMTKQIS